MKLKPSARIALSIQLAFATTAAWSLPEGANIGAGQVGIQAIGPGAMQISASHGAIINWRGFSIGAQELVHPQTRVVKLADVRAAVGSQR